MLDVVATWIELKALALILMCHLPALVGYCGGAQRCTRHTAMWQSARLQASRPKRGAVACSRSQRGLKWLYQECHVESVHLPHKKWATVMRCGMLGFRHCCGNIDGHSGNEGSWPCALRCIVQRETWRPLFPQMILMEGTVMLTIGLNLKEYYPLKSILFYLLCHTDILPYPRYPWRSGPENLVHLSQNTSDKNDQNHCLWSVHWKVK